MRIITWNFHCVPVPPLGCPVDHIDRVADYAAHLVDEHDPDILVLNEAFVANARDSILNRMRLVTRAPWTATPSDVKSATEVGSGVVVAWRKDRARRAGSVHKITFRECCQFDCLAAKGAIHVPFLTPQGDPYSILATHMQSWEIPMLCAGVRRSQVDAISSMVDDLIHRGKIDDLEPVIYCGDFNEEPSERFSGQLSAIHVRCEGPCKTHKIGQVDNFYIRNADRNMLKNASARIVHAPRQRNPSDHEPLMMVT